MNAECLDIISVIVDSFASIGAIVAIFIGVRANGLAKKANDATNNELKQTLRLHNQSIALGLLNKRCEIIQEIENIECPKLILERNPKKPEYNEPAISKAHLSIFFDSNSKISELYSSLIDDIKKVLIDIGEVVEFSRLNGRYNDIGEYQNEIWEEILAYENRLALPNSTLDDEKDFKEYCENNIAIRYIQELELHERYNYYIIRNRYYEDARCFEEHKKELLSIMEKPIKDSLALVEG